MSSGVTVNPDCVVQYQELKLRKKFTYIIFCLDRSLNGIIVEKARQSTNYEEFLEDLPPNDCRYAIYDFQYETGEGKRNKICFISWSPDDARIKYKMVYASSKDALRRELVGIGAEIQATEYSEISFEAVQEKVTRRH